MGNNNGIFSAEVKELLNSLSFLRRIGYHFIRNTRYLRDLFAYMLFRIHKSGKFIPYLSVYNSECTYFSNLFPCSTQSCRFYIKYYKFTVQRLVCITCNSIRRLIVYEVSLYPIYDFEITAFFGNGVAGIHCIRICLSHTMVSYSNRRHSPFICTFDKISGT